jgi:hypothetical protein
MNQGIPIDEILENYNNHRDKYEFENQQKMKGWEEHKYSHHRGYKPSSEFHMNQTFGDKYNLHNVDEVVIGNRYWDSKENDEYWSLSKWERLKLLVKEKVSLSYYKDFIILNIILTLILIYYANKKSKQIIL